MGLECICGSRLVETGQMECPAHSQSNPNDEEAPAANWFMQHTRLESEALSRIAESPGVAAVTLGIGTNDILQHALLRDPDSNELCALDPTPACEAYVGGRDITRNLDTE